MIHIIRGNTKIGNTANISLPPVSGCVNSLLCQDKCYAVKFYQMYPEVKRAWDANLKEVTENSNYYFEQVRRYLLRYRPRYFRWHVAGDILDQNYFDNMQEIAEDYYFVNFVCFTKNYELRIGALPPNLSLIVSIWPGIPFPKRYEGHVLPMAFLEVKEETRATNYIKCRGFCETCRACWNLAKMKTNVMLPLH